MSTGSTGACEQSAAGRPTHGFALARIAAGDAGVIEIAEHLGVTKQAVGQLVDEPARSGYVEKRPHPSLPEPNR
ncbi:MAG TPA: MarR family transcriptional regulator [Candidatus Stackebrandtia excrementipullorum]|nr:MarR family transcriptional regulator [Candidatus Stackebrandtia excrementipullorum]